MVVLVLLYRMFFKIKHFSCITYEYLSMFREKLHTLFPE